ncbi:MAG: hypothetical protein HYS12_17340 [Planctomycetes bacterium]|nr:hypothetical protein [Planctomycetota bacterium]
MNGPPQRELTLGYWWTEEENDAGVGPLLTTDWADVRSPWGYRRPRPGEHFLVLLTADKRRAVDLNGVDGGPVCHVWRGVGAGHGLVRGFEDAVKYLKAKEDKTRDELFRKLCTSPFRSIRDFAMDAAFSPIDRATQTVYGGSYDPVRQSRVVLEFLRLAGPRMYGAEEKFYVTIAFGHWLEHSSASEVTAEAVSAFEDWYMTELAASNPVRRRWALHGLHGLIGVRGVADTLALFKKAGRAGLEKRLRDCLHSPDENVELTSQELLDKLGRNCATSSRPMKARTVPSLLLLAGFVTLVLIVSRHPEDADEPSTEVERIEPPVDRGEDVYGGYHTLAARGPMYAGTVLSVTVRRSGPRGGPDGPPEEWGVFQFRVDRTVVGPDVRELTLGYWWLDDSQLLLSENWLCNDGPWREPPRAGQHLLLLLVEKERVKEWTRRLGGPVCHVWRGVRADHTLVQGFADAVKFLATKDTKTQDQLFHTFCQSPFASHRQFAFDVAFHAINYQDDHTVFGGTYNSRRQAQLVLRYLRFAVPKLTEDKERYTFTSQLSFWLRGPRALAMADPVSEITGSLRASFEDWYLTELAAVDRPVRCIPALSGLEELIESLGTAETFTLFKKRGRAGLEERLRACARAQHSEIQEKSRKLLEKLGRE